ncbi:MAG: hypothetical protein KF830_08785 [Planctomycetes bacterium]|nr:hypothetical protein [Planctomycetota bacterium]
MAVPAGVRGTAVAPEVGRVIVPPIGRTPVSVRVLTRGEGDPGLPAVTRGLELGGRGAVAGGDPRPAAPLVAGCGEVRMPPAALPAVGRGVGAFRRGVLGGGVAIDEGRGADAAGAWGAGRGAWTAGRGAGAGLGRGAWTLGAGRGACTLGAGRGALGLGAGCDPRWAASGTAMPRAKKANRAVDRRVLMVPQRT